MQNRARIVQQTVNQFIFEFEEQEPARQLKEGIEFQYKGKKHKVLRAYEGMTIPGCYTFLVITETL